MISIIICSVNQNYLKDVSENILYSIGVEYELLVWDNRIAKKGLCEVYNMMAAKAKYDYLCFLHEDILFENTGWGKILCDVFAKNPAIGMTGVAGSNYKSKMYSGWYTGVPAFDAVNITHRHRATGEDVKMYKPVASQKDALHRVVCIDGVMINCRRSLWEKVKFDEQLIKGFHFYDIDFSLRAGALTEIVVLLNIDIVHITFGGDFGDKWVAEAIRFHQHSPSSLPLYLYQPDERDAEYSIAAHYLDRLKAEKISLANRRKWLLDQKLYRVPSLWYAVLRFLVYEPFQLHRLHRHFKKA